MLEGLGMLFIVIVTAITTLFLPAVAHATIDNPATNTSDNIVISEIAPSTTGKGFIEFYNNSTQTSYGWHNFFFNPHMLGIDNFPNITLPPIYGLSSLKPHGTAAVTLDQIWLWAILRYFEFFNNDALNEVSDALDEQPGYSYQRCLTRDKDGNALISDRFYYAKSTRGKQIDCSEIKLYDPKIFDAPNTCKGLKFNEIMTNAPTEQQFVEVKNIGTEPVDLSTCYLTTNQDWYNAIALGETTLQPGEFYAAGFPYDETDPSSHYLSPTSGHLRILTSNHHALVDELIYTKQKPDTALALDDTNHWQYTTLLTPGKANDFSQPAKQPAPSQKISQKDPKIKQSPAPKPQPTLTKPQLLPTRLTTHRPTLSLRQPKLSARSLLSTRKTPKSCPDGYILNPDSNRCNKVTPAKTKKTNAANDTPAPEKTAVSNQVDYSVVCLLGGLGIIALLLVGYQIASAKQAEKQRRQALTLTDTKTKPQDLPTVPFK